MKYAIQLSTTGSFYPHGRAKPSLDEAKLFDDYLEADEARRGCNDLWVRRGVIVQVHVIEVRRVVEDCPMQCIKYALKLRGFFYNAESQGVTKIDKATLFESTEEADRVRRWCNGLWLRRSDIVQVRLEELED